MQYRDADPQPDSPQDDTNSFATSAKRRKTGHSGDGLLAREMGLMREGRGKSSATFLGSASGIHFIRSVYGAIGTPITHETSSANDLVPGEDDRLASETSSNRQHSIWQNQEIQHESMLDVSFEDLTQWTESYFDIWHPAFPLLHAPSVLDNLELISQGKISRLQLADITIIKAIISLSLADRRQTKIPLNKQPPKELVFNTFDEAVECIQSALTRPSTIASLQSVVCVQLFLVSMLRLNAASRIGGLVAQMAFQLGLHRCPARYESFSSQDQLLRKRLFWSVYCIEKYVSQALGLPLTLRDEDIDVCHLNEEHHRSRAQEPTYIERDDRLQLLAFLAQHAQIRGAIVELRNKRMEERDRSPDTAIFITARLTQWWNEVEDFLEQLESPSISDLHRTILETSRHESVIMLNRPLLALPKHTASYAGAIHACIGAAKSLLASLCTESDGQISGPESNKIKPLVWPSFTWATWMSAFILMYGAAEGKVSHSVAIRNIDRGLKVLARLASRGSVWPQACAVAIEDLKSTLDRQRGTAVYETVQSPAKSSPNTSSIPRVQSQINRNDKQTKVTSSSSRSVLQRSSEQSPFNASTAQSQHNMGWDSSTVSESCRQGYGNTASSSNHDNNQAYWPLDAQSFSNLLQTFPHNPVATDVVPGGGMQPISVPPMALGETDPFQGFDIPFWFGQDNYLAWAGEKGGEV